MSLTKMKYLYNVIQSRHYSKSRVTHLFFFFHITSRWREKFFSGKAVHDFGFEGYPNKGKEVRVGMRNKTAGISVISDEKVYKRL